MEPKLIAGFPPDLPAAGDGKLYFKSVNVGLGDCSIIIMPNGKVVMIDCGSARRAGVTADDIRGELPRAHGALRPIELLVMTHPDRDHYSLIGDVLTNTYIKRIVYSMELRLYQLYKFRNWYWKESNVNAEESIDVNPASTAEIMLLDGTKGVRLYAVAANVPYAGNSEAMSKNTASVVVVGRDNANNLFLVAADGTCTTENFMLGGGRSARISNVHVMRVGHHGSDTSSRATFVAATNPSYASIVSSSRDNGSFCLPKESVVNRWLNQMPAAGKNITVGYWADGAGVECRGAALDEEDVDREPEGLALPYDYATKQTTKRFYETFIDGTQAIEWGPY